MHKWFLDFRYNEYGKGVLEVHNNSLISLTEQARTGSISRAGNLVNKIMPGIWRIFKPSVDTTETAMEWEKGFGWKVRLYKLVNGIWKWTHFLIHPDGSGKGVGRRKDGTAGCIGVQGNCLDLRYEIDKILDLQDNIEVYVNTPIPKE